MVHRSASEGGVEHAKARDLIDRQSVALGRKRGPVSAWSEVHSVPVTSILREASADLAVGEHRRGEPGCVAQRLRHVAQGVGDEEHVGADAIPGRPTQKVRLPPGARVAHREHHDHRFRAASRATRAPAWRELLTTPGGGPGGSGEAATPFSPGRREPDQATPGQRLTPSAQAHSRRHRHEQPPVRPAQLAWPATPAQR